jgi:hypothetical protein
MQSVRFKSGDQIEFIRMKTNPRSQGTGSGQSVFNAERKTTMSDPVDNGSPTVFVGSHLKANVGYGTGGDPNSSSLEPGQQIKRTPEGKALVGKPVSAAPGDWQTRPVSAEQKVATAQGMKDPNAGRFSGKVPPNGRPVTGHTRTNDGPIKAN